MRREVFPLGGTVWETIESESYVCVAGDSEGGDRVSLVLKLTVTHTVSNE